MADERRRELRRRRILENSEARREKIFGVTKSTNVREKNADAASGHPSGITFTPAFATSTPLPNTNGGPSQHSGTQEDNLPSARQPLPQSKSNSSSTNYCTPLTSRENTLPPVRVNTNDVFLSANGQSGEDRSFPDVGSLIGSRNGAQRNRLSRSPVVNDPRLSNTDDFTLGSSFELNADSQPITKISDHALLPCFLALLVCCFLCIGLGDAVFSSLVIPFILFEGQRALWQAWQERSDSQGSGGPGGGGGGGGGGTGLIYAALLLCGVQQHLTARYMAIITTVRRLSSDFALYLVTVVLWQIIIGLPQGTEDFAQKAASAVDTGDSEHLSGQTVSDNWLNT